MVKRRVSAEKTKVIFRKWPESEGGDVIAIFPEEVGDASPYTCSMYEHVGQHGSGDPSGVIQRTKLAKPSEYADLKRELGRIGYKLEVIARTSSSMLEVRRKKLREMGKRNPSRKRKPVSKSGRRRTKR